MGAVRRQASSSRASGISGSADTGQDGCAGSMSTCKKKTPCKAKLGQSPGSPAAGSDVHVVSERSMVEQLQVASTPPCKKTRREASANQSLDLPAADSDVQARAAEESCGIPVTILSRSIIFAGWEYATLDRISPTETKYGSQERFRPLPDDWEFSPTEPAIVSEVIQRFPWSTGALVCGDGRSHDTSKGLHPGSSSFQKITFRKGTYRPALNHTAMDISTYRILIRRPVRGAFPGICTPPKKSGCTQDRTFMCPEVEQHSRFKKLIARII